MEDSLFTKIIKREIPANIEYEDGDIIAFKDINPQAPVHILIVPKIQIPTINDLDESNTVLIGKIIFVAQKLAKQHLIDNGAIGW